MECVFHCVEEFLCLILLQLGLWCSLFSFRLIASAYLDYGSGTAVDSRNFAILFVELPARIELATFPLRVGCSTN